MHAARRISASLVCLALGFGHAAAKTLEVGPDAAFKKPSDAIAAAANGDTVAIAPGQYFDCAIVRQSALTIQGTGPGVVLTDRTCAGKALLVVAGRSIVVRDLTLQRARVPDGNGAGIRYEGGNLTVERVQFLNNENGILGGDARDGTVRIVDSVFQQNGRCARACAHGAYLGHVKLVRIERSRFLETRQGHHVKSRALRTEVIDCDIADGPNGTSSYLIEIPNGGSLLVRGSRLEKGPMTENAATAISIGAEGVQQPTEQILIEGSTFTNDQSRPTIFVRNITATPADLRGNVFKGQVRPFEGDGALR
ncbi:MAG: hypothetical protein BGO51_19915 [Rhodospirillales bacterium 69-11]|nr:hypothetical protein [Rhodospirillales bacterium]MBN8902713.1 hypothetical protein [Rhodospirillales bacterium]OJW28729.1 MAG: hypothetical protein BGO51_19915 [Rhodospirillales bacterium 69-11]